MTESRRKTKILLLEQRKHREMPGLGIRQNGADFPLTRKEVHAIAEKPPAQPEPCLTT
jgi:hypothetical protein